MCTLNCLNEIRKELKYLEHQRDNLIQRIRKLQMELNKIKY